MNAKNENGWPQWVIDGIAAGTLKFNSSTTLEEEVVKGVGKITVLGVLEEKPTSLCYKLKVQIAALRAQLDREQELRVGLREGLKKLSEACGENDKGWRESYEREKERAVRLEERLVSLSVDLAASKSQTESWERGYYRELKRRKEQDVTLETAIPAGTRIKIVTFYRKVKFTFEDEFVHQIVVPASFPQEWIEAEARRRGLFFRVDHSKANAYNGKPEDWNDHLAPA